MKRQRVRSKDRGELKDGGREQKVWGSIRLNIKPWMSVRAPHTETDRLHSVEGFMA